MSWKSSIRRLELHHCRFVLWWFQIRWISAQTAPIVSAQSETSCIRTVRIIALRHCRWYCKSLSSCHARWLLFLLFLLCSGSMHAHVPPETVWKMPTKKQLDIYAEEQWEVPVFWDTIDVMLCLHLQPHIAIAAHFLLQDFDRVVCFCSHYCCTWLDQEALLPSLLAS